MYEMFKFVKNWLRKPKVYKYETLWGRGHEDWIVQDWNKISEILKRDGYKLEIVKINAHLHGSTIYYRYVKENEE